MQLVHINALLNDLYKIKISMLKKDHKVEGHYKC